MIRAIRVLGFFLILLSVFTPSADAWPEYLSRFEADPFRRTEVEGCSVCHLNPRGGGPLNDFGTAFETADHQFTLLLRASFPDRFKFETVKLASGYVFYFSDPESKFAVFERDQKKVVVDLNTLTVPAKTEKETIPPAENRMSFFVTSKGMGNGGHLEGLAGADRQCQSLAAAAGAGDRTWRAYLSTSFEGQPAVNAADRIGSGPWYNANHVIIARGVADLLSGNRITRETALNEKSEKLGNAEDLTWILTGSLPNGTAAVGMSCNNWTSAGEGQAMLGQLGRAGEKSSSWNSGRPTNGCSQQALHAAGSDGLFYCFAIRN